MLTLRAVAIATGMIDAVVFATALALVEAVAVMPAAAVLDGADDRHPVDTGANNGASVRNFDTANAD